jgi:hypothetical protein
METMTLAPLGPAEIAGVRGGEMIGPAAFLLPVWGACVVAVANNWGAFKESFAAGFSAGASGNW